MNELGGHPHSLTRTDHRTFHDGVDFQFASNLRQALSRTFVWHDGGSRDDTQRANFGKISNQLVGHTVRKELLGRVARQIGEGQNGNGIQARSSSSTAGSPASPRQPEDNACYEDCENHAELEGMRSSKPEVPRPVGGRRGAGSTREYWKVCSIHWRDKPVSAPRQRFDIARLLGGVAEHLPQAGNRIVEAMVEIDESVGGPNLRSQLFASNQIAGT